jgi:hypothetical protein
MQQPAIVPPKSVRAQGVASDEALPAVITRTASKQTYYTIRLLVDRAWTHDAYRAYAYFRWVDDWLDERVSDRSERQAFIDRQQALVDACYQDVWPHALTVEEQMLVDLIRGDSGHSSGLQSNVRHMTCPQPLLMRCSISSATGNSPRKASHAVWRPLAPTSHICCATRSKTSRRDITTFPPNSLRLTALVPGTWRALPIGSGSRAGSSWRAPRSRQGKAT